MEKTEPKTICVRKSVLVAMSDRATQYKYSARLADAGFDVANVSDANECLDALRCRAFDILVVELELPLVGTERIIEVMRKDPEIQTIPAVIIELSDDSMQERDRHERAPFAMEELVQVIKSRLHLIAH